MSHRQPRSPAAAGGAARGDVSASPPSVDGESGPRDRRGLLSLRLLSSVAFGVSAFLLWGSWSGQPLPGCGVVLHSRWAYWLGVPVSLFALLAHAGVLVAILPGKASSSRFRTLSDNFLVAAAVAVIGAALWFIGLQLLVLHAICPFCMVAHACGLVVGGLLFRRLAAGEFQLPPRTAFRCGLAGFLLVVALGAGQVAHAPPDDVVQPMPAGVRTTAGPKIGTAGPALNSGWLQQSR